jgi:hypothetical protein
MVAYLDHAVVASPVVDSRAVLGLAGQMSITYKVASGGNPRSSNQSMMSFVRYFLREGIS